MRKIKYGAFIFLSILAAFFVITLLLKPFVQLPLLHTITVPHYKPKVMKKAVIWKKIHGKKVVPTLTWKVLVDWNDTGVESVMHRSAYSVEWDDASFQSLRDNYKNIEVLRPEWFTVTATWLQDIDTAKITRTRAYLDVVSAPCKLMPIINNYNSENNVWDADRIDAVLRDDTQRQTLIDQIIKKQQDLQLEWVSIDFEDLHLQTHPFLLKFLAELSQQFSGRIAINVPLENNDWDYAAIADSVDELVVMAYDEHWASATPWPISSMGWFDSWLQSLLKIVPASKVTVALWNYGYDWTTAKKEAQALTFQEAITTDEESSGEVMYDPASLNPTYQYYDDNDVVHTVRYLDATTLYNQMMSSERLGVTNFALWRLGSEDPSLWNLLDESKSDTWEDWEHITAFQAGYDIDYEGTGEIYKILHKQSLGSRTLSYDTGSDTIMDETIKTFPSPYMIGKFWSTSWKQVALTFDDGPDGTWTPQILNVLKQHHVTATFFLVGTNIEKYPALTNRIRQEWNLIWNHTLTHPDISQVSNTRLDIELTTTQRLLESIVGRATTLFRPPYAEDVEPVIIDDVKPLEYASTMWYISVGMHVDPNDWQTPWVDAIVQRTLDQVEQGRWQIVLLHDGWGNRAQTVAALPRLIDALEQSGYKIVGLDTLLGVTTGALMPPLQGRERAVILPDVFTFHAMSYATWITYYVLTFTLLIWLLRLVMIVFLAYRYRQEQYKRKWNSTFQPRVAVIVPAYNEEKVIVRTIESLFQSTYEKFEIIVVDDWSKDATYDVCVKAYWNDPRVAAYTKPNWWKAAAINYGMTKTDAEIIIVLDADTIFAPQTITTLARHFIDPRVWAVAGNVKVGNRINPMAKFQALEYISSQNLDRRAYDLINAITIVPGAVGARRKDAILAVWWFTWQTLTEDADLTMEVLRSGYKISHEEDAIAYTEAPDTIWGFIKQRLRRTFGILQTTYKHIDLPFDKNVSPALRFFIFPHMILFQIIVPLLAPILDLVTLITFLFLLVDWWYGNHTHLFGALYVVWYCIAFLLLDYWIALIAFSFEKAEDKRLIWLVPLQKMTYRFLMYYVSLKSLRRACTGTWLGWNKLERKNTVVVDSGIKKPK